MATLNMAAVGRTFQLKEKTDLKERQIFTYHRNNVLNIKV